MAEHDRHLHGVLFRLAKYNATVRVDKCVIGQPEVEFNGQLISAAGLRPLQLNVESILRNTGPSQPASASSLPLHSIILFELRGRLHDAVGAASAPLAHERRLELDA